MNHDQQGVFFLQAEIGRGVKHAFDRRAVGRLPRNHCTMSKRKSLQLIAHGGELLVPPRSDTRVVDFRILIFKGRPVSHSLVVLRK